MTCSTSYCLVTLKDLWNVYMYVCMLSLIRHILSAVILTAELGIKSYRLRDSSFHHCAQNKAEINPGSLEIKWPQYTTDHFPSSGSKVENICSVASTAALCLHRVVLSPVATSFSFYISNLLIKLLVCSTEQHDTTMCRGADRSLARPTSRFILFDGEIFRLMLVLLYINSTNIPPIMIINRIYETQNRLIK
jgi:hypothetical protein